MWHEAIVTGIAHGRVQKPIDDERARGLVHLVFYGFAANRHLHDDIDVLGRIQTDGNSINAHRSLLNASHLSRVVMARLPRGGNAAPSGCTRRPYRWSCKRRQAAPVPDRPACRARPPPFCCSHRCCCSAAPPGWQDAPRGAQRPMRECLRQSLVACALTSCLIGAGDAVSFAKMRMARAVAEIW